MRRHHDLDALRAFALLLQRRCLPGLLKNRVLRIALPLIICIPTIRNLEFMLNQLTRGDNPTSAAWFNAVVLHDLSNLWFLWQLLLLAWTREVRYSWFGTLLNGKRERHAAEPGLAPLGSPAPLL